jgi:phosphoribosyl-dephospho-CoA transferase
MNQLLANRIKVLIKDIETAMHLSNDLDIVIPNMSLSKTFLEVAARECLSPTPVQQNNYKGPRRRQDDRTGDLQRGDKQLN